MGVLLDILKSAMAPFVKKSLLNIGQDKEFKQAVKDYRKHKENLDKIIAKADKDGTKVPSRIREINNQIQNKKGKSK